MTSLASRHDNGKPHLKIINKNKYSFYEAKLSRSKQIQYYPAMLNTTFNRCEMLNEVAKRIVDTTLFNFDDQSIVERVASGPS